MKLINITPHVYQVDFETRKKLLKTFLRFQERYESPEFKDKYFTLKEYKTWYKSFYEKNRFTYYSDWSGCNVPSRIFDDFRNGLMNPLSKAEKELLKKLPKEGKYYVIGTFGGGNEGVIEHEIAHGLYYTNENYKKEVDTVLKCFEKNHEQLFDFLLKKGYHKDVVWDEIHAYLITNKDYLDKEGVEYSLYAIIKLQEIFKEYKELDGY